MKLYLVMIIIIVFFIQFCDAAYQVGTGIADVTGPAAEIYMVIIIFFIFILMLW